MDDYTKVLTVHDYIIKNTVYDSQNVEKDSIPHEDYYAYGVLVKGIGVSGGYTKAMKLLLNKAGVECLIVEGGRADGSPGIGDGTRYIWNIVKIDGNYYHMDVSADDIERNGRGSIVYYFFNVDDEGMKKVCEWDQKKYPACTSTKHNYFYINNMVADNYDEAFSIIRNALRVKREKLLVKIADYDNSIYNIENMIREAFQKSGLRRLDGASWYTYEDLGIIDIEFKY